MNLVTSHPMISSKLILSGKFWLLGFDLGENIFLPFFTSFPVAGWSSGAIAS